MKTSITVPSLGNEITEAVLEEWLVSTGDTVEKGDQVLILTTPKVALEIEAPVSGIVSELHVDADDLVEEGTVLATIEHDG